MIKLDLSGRRFGRYEVVSYRGRRGHNALWECRCDCGTVRDVQGTNLTSGNSSSCGCHKIAMLHKHGKSGGNNVKSRAYVSWNMMRDRCGNPNNPEYHNYGGRGITCCPEWDSFEVFFRDMGERAAGLSLHRIDNELGYFPGNCCWADSKTQHSNMRRHGRQLFRQEYQRTSITTLV